jgi:rhodanese-related sulfurtransferase
MKQVILISLFLLLTLTACTGSAEEITGRLVTVPGGSYKNINPAELNPMLSDKDFVFINVHIPFAGNIQDTDLSIPYDQINIPDNLRQLPKDMDAKIVLYCRSGRMSEIASTELVSIGYTNIWNLDGGMVAWEQTGHKIEK